MVVATIDGAQPHLFHYADRARAVVGRDGPSRGPWVFDLTPGAAKQPLFADGALTYDDAEEVDIVPLLVRREKGWFSVIERAGGPSGNARVRLVERDEAGRAKVVETHMIHAADAQRGSLYDRAGKTAVVQLGSSVYAFTRRALVLDGPGAELGLFAERDAGGGSPTYDLTALIGVAPNGSFVTATSGLLMRVGANGAGVYRYEGHASRGVVGDLHVTLVHAGEAPRIVRWYPPPPPSKGPTAPSGEVRDIALGIDTVLGRGSFDAVTEDASGNLYAVRADGALLELTEPAPLYEPSDGCRAVSALGLGEHRVAWVVTCIQGSGRPRHFVWTAHSPAASH